jgi:hypothetical protein
LVEGQQQTVTVDFKNTTQLSTTDSDALKQPATPVTKQLEAPATAATVRGKLTLGVGFSALSYEREVQTYEVKLTSRQIGAFGAPSLQLGYGVTDHLLMGFAVSVIGWTGESTLGGSSNDDGALTATVSVLPSYEFENASIVRPFIGAMLAVQLHPEDSNRGSYWRVAVGGRAGLRIFVSPGLSIDCALSGDGGGGRGREKALALGSRKLDTWGPITRWQVGLQLGVSAWVN